jgi:rsbT co-antagonist protein RsbR
MAVDLPSDNQAADEREGLRAQVRALQREAALLRGVLEALPFGVFWKDTDLVYRGANRETLRFTGFGEAADDAGWVGRTDYDLPWTRAQSDGFVADDRAVLAARQPKPHIVEEVRDAAGRVVWVETYKAPVFGRDGELLGLVGTHRDLTQQKLAAEAALARQRALLAELATPLLPVADGVVVLPVIGVLDPERAAQVMQALLAGVVQHRARVAILDITGLHTVDTTAADALLRAARAIRLLGAEAVVTGVQPAVAHTLVALGTDLGDVVILGDLKAGIAHAIAR